MELGENEEQREGRNKVGSDNEEEEEEEEEDAIKRKLDLR